MPWFTAQAREDKPRHAHVVIDKPIGSDWAPDWISDFIGQQPAREFIAAVDALGELDEIDVDLNTPGGDVASGVRIFHYLRDHPAKVNIRVTGMAASIGTIIMMAGDTRSMAIGSTMMTHRASALICGAFNVAEMEEIANNLKKVDASLVDIYAKTTGKSAAEINELLDKGDTYLTAEEALEWGFATQADEELRAVASADIKPFMRQLEQAAENAQLRAQLRGQGNQAAMTAAEALALAFDITPEEAEAQAADLGDQILALRKRQPSNSESITVNSEWLFEQHPTVATSIFDAGRDEALEEERTRITAILKACQTTGQPQLMEKLVANGMAAEQASEYIYDVAAAHGNAQHIHNSHSPEGGHKKAIDYQKIYDRQNRRRT